MSKEFRNPPKKKNVLYHDQTNYLFDHILGGFEGNVNGLKNIHNDNLVTEQEYHEFLEKAALHLINRIREFKRTNGLVSIVFALLFTGIQIIGGNNVMVRGRTGRSGRRNEYEFVLDKA